MAIVTIPEQGRKVEGEDAIRTLLAPFGVDYERAEPNVPVGPDAPSDAVLAAYREKIDDLKTRGGYVTADVIDVFPTTPGLDAMLNRFNSEHWHSEDEVRFIVEGRGVFHIDPPGGPVFAIEVEAGDLISVPRGTLHWFDLCADRRIRAIRLFQDSSGWTPHYTDSGVDANFQPVCFGSTYIQDSTRTTA